MKKFSPWKLVAACVLAAGGVVAACTSQMTPAAPPFPMDRYDAAQQAKPHGQLLRVAQTEPYARDAGVGSGSATRDGGAGGARDAGGAGSGSGSGKPRSVNPTEPPPNVPPAQPPTPGPRGDQNPTPIPGPSPSPTPTPTPPPAGGTPR